MFDRDNCSHTISDIHTGKIAVFFLQNSQFSCIVVHNRGKHGLETCQMGSAFCIVNVITKSKNIFMEFVDILENPFHRNSITLS